MPGYPDRDGGPLAKPAAFWGRFTRFFCSRKGAATGRAAMMLCALILPPTLTGGGWVAGKILEHMEKTETAIIELDKKFAAYASGDQQAGTDRDRRLGNIEGVTREFGVTLGDHERRIYRMEGRR